MKTGLDYDYEFIFSTGIFDIDIYNQCSLPDVSNTRQTLISDAVDVINRIFINVPGLHQFSTFIDDDSYRYKVTVINIK